ncbi:sigma-54 interaction domain-containing protein [Pseudalkalibacillus decolorationis]|uniref:sigma-54 interaction domain-containing protein n=1 Tax=Pseudalkalibacillus decolorationis TaxID=163879 RepID=UPI00214959CD|nr:sigma 54-interacting transcriptional regulator [Pseudalkalibacillus decolorationis]
MKDRDKHWDEYEAILHSLKDDILVTNVKGIIVKVSEATCEIYGVNPEELIGESVYKLEKEGLFTPLATPKVIQQRKKVTFIQTTNDEKRLLVTGIPVFDKHGELVRIVSYSHDVTELIEMKKYLAEMENEMELVKRELEMFRNRNVSSEGLIAKSKEMKNVISMVLQIASVDVNVLLQGETGVGKSHIAKTIHRNSPRNDGPFIEVNCGAIPETIFEAEIFGYEAGAFTGASRGGKPGLAELANGGTLFLDEIGELSLSNQVKVLKFIQEKQFYRVGGTKMRKVDFRLITATNQNLEEAVAERRFRQDLYFRLNVVPITIPSLRQRQDDIIPLTEHFVDEFSKKYNLQRVLDEGVVQQLLIQEWRGNVRELINLIERLIVTSQSPIIMLNHLPESYRQVSNDPFIDPFPQSLPKTIEHVEKHVLQKAKQQYKTTVQIAKYLGISQPSVVRKLKKYEIE